MKQIKPIFYLEREKEELNQRKRLKLEWMASVMQQLLATRCKTYEQMNWCWYHQVPSSFGTTEFGYYQVWLQPILATTK